MDNISNYVFNGTWTLLSKEYPPSGNRVILTDGNSIIIGSATIEENKVTWLFDKNELNGYDPIAWMETPKILKQMLYEKES